jgi:hypothetical protein
MEAAAGGWLRTDGRLRARTRRQQGEGEGGGKGKLLLAGPLVLAVGDVASVGGGGGDDKTAFAAELQGEAAAGQVGGWRGEGGFCGWGRWAGCFDWI